MAKKLFSFLMGVGITSAWWPLALWGDDARGERWILPTMATLFFAVVAIVVFVQHWDD